MCETPTAGIAPAAYSDRPSTVPGRAVLRTGVSDRWPQTAHSLIGVLQSHGVCKPIAYHHCVKVISASVFGSDPLYLLGAERLVHEAKHFYPDFVVRLYVGESIPAERVLRFRDAGAQVVQVQGDEGYAGTFWRFAALSDPEIEIALFRDVDSVPTEREVAAVNQWLDEGRTFHIMRDHPRHHVFMLAGMWGARTSGAQWVADQLADFEMRAPLGADQYFLRKCVYRRAVRDAVVHDSIFSVERGRKRFPTIRQDGEYVGEVVQLDGSFDEHFRNLCIRVDSSRLLRARVDWNWRLRRIAKTILGRD